MTHKYYKVATNFDALENKAFLAALVDSRKNWRTEIIYLLGSGICRVILRPMIVELAPFFDLGIDAIIEIREACYWYNTSNYQPGHIWIPQHVMVIKSEVCGHQIVFGVIDLKSEWIH